MEKNNIISDYDREKINIFKSYFEDLLSILNDEYSDLEIKNLLKTLPFHIDEIALKFNDLSFEHYLSLLSTIDKNLNINDLGLKIGSMKSVKNFGIYGYALMSSSTFEQFISVADRIFYTIYDSLIINHNIKNDMLEISYTSKNKKPNNLHRILMEQVVTCGISLMNNQLPEGVKWSECILNCDYPSPKYSNLYTNYFFGKINFNKPIMQLCVPAKWLNLPLKTGNNFIFSLCDIKVNEILSNLNNNNMLANKIRHILLKSSFNQLPSSKYIADSLHMSERTLRLNLSKEDTCYRDILNEIRNEVALKYLTQSSLSIQEIAFSLGYTHTQNFYRAFLKRNNITPEKYRQQHK